MGGSGIAASTTPWDGRELPDGQELEADVCIVGAGPAGISVALELRQSGLDVLLLESGGWDPDPEVQALADGENLGHPYFPLEAARLRYFGGSSNHWGGNSRPLDADDFAVRPWVPRSGWPITREALEPYYVAANRLCGLGAPDYGPDPWPAEDGAGPLPLEDGRFESGVFLVEGTRFGTLYRQDLLDAPNVQIVLNASLIELELPAGSSAVSHARVGALGGGRFRVKARAFVLAAGGIDNARLLLASRSTREAGLGNEHDLVGRTFMEHLGLGYAVFLATTPAFDTRFYAYRAVGDRLVRGVLAPTERAKREARLRNFHVAIQPAFSSEISQGVESAKLIMRSIRRGGLPDDLGTHLYRVLADIDHVAPEFYRRFVLKEPAPESFQLYMHAEQSPDPESRVLLSSERDALGVPRAALRWRIGEEDLDSLERGLRLVAESLSAAGYGRARLPEEGDRSWAELIKPQFHHMGTTRMADDPRAGVVDRHCRLHSVPNVYLAGSSVFPTSGHANPTLTLVALAVRLAERIEEELA